MKKFLTFLGIIPLGLLLWTGFPPPEAGGADGTVGVAICKGCHEDRYKTYLMSTQSKKTLPGGPANKEGCESCHGPGAAHVEKSGEGGVGIFIFSKRIEDAKAKSAKCLACHSEGRDLAFWDMAKHKTVGVSCDQCHTVHSGTRKNLKALQPDLCNTCHLQIRAQQNRQSHHPIREGKVKCTDCHEHHGGFGPHQIKADSVNELCYTCHAEKRGPFMWEHPPVDERCTTCHTPHGSNHNKLLFQKPPLLCQSCHDATQHPGTIYSKFEGFQAGPGNRIDRSNKFFARACLNCHSNIHGSNGPSTRGQFFLR